LNESIADQRPRCAAVKRCGVIVHGAVGRPPSR
jgi:hypothetical protein